MGDFNARSSSLCDHTEPNIHIEEVAWVESDVRILLENGISLARYSRDNVANNSGYKIIEMCKDLGVFIVNARLGSDYGIGKYTCKNASVVDYILMSPKLLTKVLKFNVSPCCVLLSDVHCLIKMRIKDRCC